uniref:Uncharacterized protein n=1 Tax=Timema douglasi TaxID=61478 RepID=A0A7R8VVK4_TIMDO|nr:unnamed protein product [Timema douglasi]
MTSASTSAPVEEKAAVLKLTSNIVNDTSSVNSSPPTQQEEHHNSLKEENCTTLSSPKVLTYRDTSEGRGTSSRSDAVTSYYDFIINEGSYKFWAVFQVATAILLIYSAFAAVYYAKYTFATTDYSDYDDDFFFRRSGTAYVTPAPPSTQSFLGLSPETFQRIMNALSSKNYS